MSMGDVRSEVLCESIDAALDRARSNPRYAFDGLLADDVENMASMVGELARRYPIVGEYVALAIVRPRALGVVAGVAAAMARRELMAGAR